MYKENIRSCVSRHDCYNCFFIAGVRQGENLSPLLFPLFLKDVDSNPNDHICNDIGTNEEDKNQFIDTSFSEILLPPYADDSPIGESKN